MLAPVSFLTCDLDVLHVSHQGGSIPYPMKQLSYAWQQLFAARLTETRSPRHGSQIGWHSHDRPLCTRVVVQSQ